MICHKSPLATFWIHSQEAEIKSTRGWLSLRGHRSPGVESSGQALALWVTVLAKWYRSLSLFWWILGALIHLTAYMGVITVCQREGHMSYGVLQFANHSTPGCVCSSKTLDAVLNFEGSVYTYQVDGTSTWQTHREPGDPGVKYQQLNLLCTVISPHSYLEKSGSNIALFMNFI